MTMNTPIWQLTTGELVELIQQAIRPVEAELEVKPDADDKYAYGIGEIADLLGCSNAQVHAYRRQGWIEPAIKQCGRKIICDKRLALELFGKRNKRNKLRVC
jgi:uncharacterized protein YjcR